MTTVPIFDGHNDVLARLYLAGGEKAALNYAQGRPKGHIDRQKAQEGGFAGGFFAIWVPSDSNAPRKAPDPAAAMEAPKYDIPLPAEVGLAEAQRVTRIQVATLKALETQGSLTICHSAQAIESTLAQGKTAALMHMEGAEAIDPDFAMLDGLYAQGLRSLGPVWSRPTRYGEGVPFRFPGSPDIGGGLTDDGKRLVRACNDRGILVDLSHLNAKGFWDVAALSSAPLVATHSNAHSLCPHARNLTDKQLDAIAESGGVAGVNFGSAFLRDDGRMVRDTPLSLIGDHIAYMIDRMGEDHVALGSDFDGAVVPHELGSAAGLQNLIAHLRRRGFGDAAIAKVAHGNWLRVLRETFAE